MSSDYSYIQLPRIIHIRVIRKIKYVINRLRNNTFINLTKI